MTILYVKERQLLYLKNEYLWKGQAFSIGGCSEMSICFFAWISEGKLTYESRNCDNEWLVVAKTPVRIVKHDLVH